MKKYILASTLLTLLILTNCVKHEVIPAPEPAVDLDASFTAVINGTDIEYTEDVDGYNGSSSFAQYTTTTAIDTHVYYSSMVSDLKTAGITIGIGGVSFEFSTLTSPSLLQFTSFFDTMVKNSLDLPATVFYSRDAKNGFNVQYTDNDGRKWISTLYHDGNTLTNPSIISVDPVFTAMEFESDNSGDYAKFSVNFSCELYRFKQYVTVGNLQVPDYDTIQMTDAIYRGWIKR